MNFITHIRNMLFGEPSIASITAPMARIAEQLEAFHQTQCDICAKREEDAKLALEESRAAAAEAIRAKALAAKYGKLHLS